MPSQPRIECCYPDQLLGAAGVEQLSSAAISALYTTLPRTRRTLGALNSIWFSPFSVDVNEMRSMVKADFVCGPADVFLFRPFFVPPLKMQIED
jgi:hypothetical protein